MLRGGITRILRQNQGLIDNLFGNLSNIAVSNNYEDAIKDLKNKDKYYNDYKSYVDTDKKMRQYQLTDDDKTQLTTGTETMNPAFVQTGTPEYQAYMQDANRPADYVKYLKDKYPDTYNQYSNNGTIITTQPVINEKSVTDFKYQKLGISPDQQKAYEQFRSNPFDYERYNRDLMDYGVNMYPSLLSTGSMGNTLANMYMQNLNHHLAPKPDVPHYKVDEDKNGNIYMYMDTDPTGTFKIIKPGSEKTQKQDWKPYGDLSYQIYKDDDGTFHRRSYLVNSDGDLKEMITPSSEDEYRSYMTNLNPPVTPKSSSHGTGHKKDKTDDEWKAEAYYGENGLANYLNDLWTDVQNSSDSGMKDLRNKWQNEADYVWGEWGKIKKDYPNMSKQAQNDIYNDIKNRMEIMGGIVTSGNKKMYGNPSHWGEK